MSLVADLLSWFFLLAGAMFTLIGGVGVLRMPDLFTRLHASGVSDMLGAGFVMIGLMFQTGGGLALVKVVLLLFFFALTSPTAAHVVAKVALRRGLKPKVDAPAEPPREPIRSRAGQEEPSTR